MNDLLFDRELRDLLVEAAPPAPASVIDRSLAAAATMSQRSPRFVRLDRRSWPPVRRSISDPAVHRAARLLAVAVIVLLLAGLIAVGARLLDQPPRVTIESAGALDAAVQDPRLLLWSDGRIFVRGSTGGNYLFDPETGTTSGTGHWGDVGASASPHVLSDGRILLIGSVDSTSPSALRPVGFFDPVSGTSTVAGELPEYRFGDSELVLRDGRILLSGGGDFSGSTPVYFATVEVFDPATGKLSPLAPLPVPRAQHEMLELDDGRILMVGGGSPQSPTGEALDVEVYDMATGTSKVVGAISSGRGPFRLKPVRLSDGRVLIQGGGRTVEPCGSPAPQSGEPAGPPSIHAIYRQDTFVFDPAGDRLLPGPELPHFTEHVVGLADGRAVAFGQYLATPAGCANPDNVYAKSWLGVVDLGRNIVFESRDPMTGQDTLALDIDRGYTDGLLLPDGRLAMIADEAPAGQRANNAVDLVTIGP